MSIANDPKLENFFKKPNIFSDFRQHKQPLFFLFSKKEKRFFAAPGKWRAFLFLLARGGAMLICIYNITNIMLHFRETAAV